MYSNEFFMEFRCWGNLQNLHGNAKCDSFIFPETWQMLIQIALTIYKLMFDTQQFTISFAKWKSNSKRGEWKSCCVTSHNLKKKNSFHCISKEDSLYTTSVAACGEQGMFVVFLLQGLLRFLNPGHTVKPSPFWKLVFFWCSNFLFSGETETWESQYVYQVSCLAGCISVNVKSITSQRAALMLCLGTREITSSFHYAIAFAEQKSCSALHLGCSLMNWMTSFQVCILY